MIPIASVSTVSAKIAPIASAEPAHVAIISGSKYLFLDLMYMGEAAHGMWLGFILFRI